MTESTPIQREINAAKILQFIKPTLNDSNYVEWSEGVKMAFSIFGVDFDVASDNTKLRSVLLLSIETAQRDACKAGSTFGEAWDLAKVKYGTPSRFIVAKLKEEFYGTAISGEGVQAFINAKRKLSVQLMIAGHDVSHEIVDVLLVGTAHIYEGLVET